MAPGRVSIGINQGLRGSGDRHFLHSPWNPWSPEALVISGLRSRVPDARMSNLLPCFGIFLALLWLKLIHSYRESRRAPLD